MAQLKRRLQNVVPVIITYCVILFVLVHYSLSISTAQETVPVGVTAAKILNFKLGESNNDFGRLKFVGGLELTSENRQFGGISGFRFFPDRTNFIAVTDKGYVINGNFKRDVARALDDVLLADVAPLPDPDGNLFTRKRDSDAEALELAGGRAFIAFENNDRINSYLVNKGRIAGNPVSEFPKVRKLRLARNKGLEALTQMPPDRLGYDFLAIAEESLNAEGNHRGFLLSADDIAELSIARIGEFGITDADYLPDGDLIILERSYSPLSGAAIQLRQIAGETIVPGAVLDGDVILAADSNYRIDNLEALDISIDENFDVFLTLVSDDNYSVLQSTIVLEFKYIR